MKDSQEPAREAADATINWQTPDFLVVETALEVTAYALTDR